jgi:hypothetical protein
MVEKYRQRDDAGADTTQPFLMENVEHRLGEAIEMLDLSVERMDTCVEKLSRYANGKAHAALGDDLGAKDRIERRANREIRRQQVVDRPPVPT